MSEEVIIESNEQIAPLSHRRILFTMMVVTLAGGIAGLIFASWQFASGIVIGGILSLLNYYWLKISLRRVFDNAVASGEKPRFLALRYFSRYLTIGAILTIIALTKFIPVVAVIAGLASFALAITFEGFIRLLTTFFNKREI